MLSCKPCRDRHVKCNKQQPRCDRCSRNDTKCVWQGRTDKKNSPRSFTKGQVWLPVPPRVDFVFEPSSSGNDSIIGVDQHQINDGNIRHDHFNIPETQLRYTSSIQLRDIDGPVPTTTSTPLASPGNFPIESPTAVNLQTPGSRASNVSTSIARPLSEGFLKSEQEATLLSHYINQIARFFDAGDLQSNFAIEVPKRARESSTLLNAIFALSARYLNRTADLDIYISDRYLRSCLQTLIPALNDSEAVIDDSILAAVVLLRFVEEIEVSETGLDRQGHGVGTQAIISALEARSSSQVEPFRRSCYWAAYRQEFSSALSSQRAMAWTVPQSIRIERPTTDFEWLLAAVQHCAQVLDYCFRDGVIQNKENFEAIMTQIQAWQRDRPSSFDPLYATLEPESVTKSNMPQIFLHAEQHAVGHAYNTLGHVLLIAHAPLAKIGPFRREQMLQVDESVRTDVYTLCGIAFANKHFPCAVLIAAMGITSFGDRFLDGTEQSILRDLLEETERLYAWPTAQIVTQLESVWNTAGV